ncbi:MAG: DNA repair protein RadC [Bacteroidales bacterium]|nr:DNA repair protein RadC [Bacteroidales bacterium]
MSDTGEYRSDPPRVLTVKERSEDDRPREKAAKYGVQSLTNSECLAIMLRSGRPGRPVTDIARDLMELNNNLFINLANMSDRQLKDVYGIGDVKVLEIRTMLEIMKRYAGETIGELPRIRQSSDVHAIMRWVNATSPYEEMWALLLNNSNQVIRKVKVSEGSSTSTIFDAKKILKEALLCNAIGIILCHNHPSGVLQPSGPDQSITESFGRACKTLDLRFLDHIIVSTEGFYSFRDQGRL